MKFLRAINAVIAVVLVLSGPAQTQSQAATWDVHAVRFASIPFRVSSLIAGADRTRMLDIAMMVWVLRGPGNRVVLVDSGFYRDKFMTQWKPAGYSKPSDAVQAALGIAPDQVTDVIISHIHWDHADGADLFPKARVWLQREEYTHHISETGTVLDRAIDPDVATMLYGIKQAGRVQLVNGDDQEIMPGVRVYTGGKHTFASQFVGVRTRSGTIVLSSDNAYLYENLEKKLPIAQTLDAASNLAAQARMITLAGSIARIVPGHDPAVFERFPAVKPGVARVD
ncbi:MAG TPA: N-acyl homoserine lactonase family protein [Vicinamibacterales bacterium]|nr:N-acyl homoserine lactonase family protein [Vicinamibacterales bacterium]